MLTSLAQFMEDALYGATGYYSANHARTGTRGDYFTAPETGDAFGQLLSNILAGWQARLKAEPFWILEGGAGEGRLMRTLARPGGTYGVMERSAARREKIRQLNMPIQ